MFQSCGSFHRLKRKVLSEALKYLEMDEIQDLALIFSQLDEDGDGYITKEEMVRGLIQLGYKVSSHDSKVIIENIDVDGNSQLDQNEFVAALLDLKTMQAIPYNEYFEDIDDEVATIIEEADTDGNGTIELSEFSRMINETAASLDTFDKRLR